MRSLPALLEGRSPSWLVGWGATLTLLLGTIERVYPIVDSIWVLSLVPIAVVTRFAHWGWGVAIALVSFLPFVMFPQPSVAPTPGLVAAIDPSIRMLLMGLLIFAVHRYQQRGETTGQAVETSEPGLASSRALFDLIATELERANRYGRPFTMAYVGIDNPPSVTLRAGPNAAEEMVKAAAQEIRRSIRALDHVALLREHEFALLLPETGPEAGAIVLDRMRRVLEKTFANERPAITFTVGAITWLNADCGVEELHQRAYQLMYHARRENVAIKHEVLDVGARLDILPRSTGGLAESTRTPHA
jgi:diguanylate cyclase (GGDEF)-like protein